MFAFYLITQYMKKIKFDIHTLSARLTIFHCNASPSSLARDGLNAVLLLISHPCSSVYKLKRVTELSVHKSLLKLLQSRYIPVKIVYTHNVWHLFVKKIVLNYVKKNCVL